MHVSKNFLKSLNGGMSQELNKIFMYLNRDFYLRIRKVGMIIITLKTDWEKKKTYHAIVRFF